MNARREKGEAFEEPRHERVGTDFLRLTIQGETACDFGKLPCKLRGRFAQMLELDVVEIQEPAIHGRTSVQGQQC